jgi:2-polyprenyl-6-methoxyphenol hydroxylase-like FAD-dependent oxidoreductase
VAHRTVTVVGAGVAGLASALLLARRGFAVDVLERDPPVTGSAHDSVRWPRPGVAHFLQPHAFIPRGRSEMRRHLPDVWHALLAAGACEVDLRAKLPGPLLPQDEQLQYLAVRRPLIEWALRRAVRTEARITVRSGVRVRGIATAGGRVTGVCADGGEWPAGMVVDAPGRRTAPSWLPADARRPAPETSDCGVVYYSRYYRQRPDFELPDGPWFLSPRGDLGYLGFASFPGDNRTFAAVLAAPAHSPQWRVLAQPRAFEAAIATIPMLASWADPHGVDPITDVLPMAGLRNSIAPADPPIAGHFPVGDAYCHTDPTLAHGLAFALIHAAAVADALAAHDDPRDAVTAYTAATRPALRERYDWITDLDAQRHAVWRGESVDVAHQDGAYALFAMAAGAAVARVDPTVFRVFNRRIGLLDSTRVLDDDVVLRKHIEAQFQTLRAAGLPPLGPSRDELLAVTEAAVAR